MMYADNGRFDALKALALKAVSTARTYLTSTWSAVKATVVKALGLIPAPVAKVLAPIGKVLPSAILATKTGYGFLTTLVTKTLTGAGRVIKAVAKGAFKACQWIAERVVDLIGLVSPKAAETVGNAFAGVGLTVLIAADLIATNTISLQEQWTAAMTADSTVRVVTFGAAVTTAGTILTHVIPTFAAALPASVAAALAGGPLTWACLAALVAGATIGTLAVRGYRSYQESRRRFEIQSMMKSMAPVGSVFSSVTTDPDTDRPYEKGDLGDFGDKHYIVTGVDVFAELVVWSPLTDEEFANIQQVIADSERMLAEKKALVAANGEKLEDLADAVDAGEMSFGDAAKKASGVNSNPQRRRRR